MADARVRDLPSYLRPGDCLVLNDTRVLAARLADCRTPSGGRIALTLLEPAAIPEGERTGGASGGGAASEGAQGDGGGEGALPACWHALAKPARGLEPGATLALGEEAQARVLARRETPGGGPPQFLIEFAEADGAGGGSTRLAPAAMAALLARYGAPPLPPYIKRPLRASDREDYQTIYAARPGAVAAPTAGLHFTESLLSTAAERGVEIVRATLHVGAGTFLPVRNEDPRAHRIHAEAGRLPPEAAETLARTRGAGGRIVAVGTTTLRLMETAWDRAGGGPQPFAGRTSLYILPGHRFVSADILLTNFHLPRSTLLLLAAAFAGRTRVLAAYRHALAAGYRFSSYGDATLLFRAGEEEGAQGESLKEGAEKGAEAEAGKREEGRGA